MTLTIKVKPDGVTLLINGNWVPIPEQSVPHFAAQCTIVKKDMPDDCMILDYDGELQKVQYQYEKIWMENKVQHKQWVNISKSEYAAKPFFLKKRKFVVIPELIEAN